MSEKMRPPWTREPCHICGVELWATRMEPRPIDEPVICEGCEYFNRGYEEGQRDANTIKLRMVREITDEEENFRVEPMKGSSNSVVIRRDPIEPEPVGTIVLMAFKIVDYKQDCDGSLMATLQNMNFSGEETGWETDCHGLYPENNLVVEAGVEGLKKMLDLAKE